MGRWVYLCGASHSQTPLSGISYSSLSLVCKKPCNRLHGCLCFKNWEKPHVTLESSFLWFLDIRFSLVFRFQSSWRSCNFSFQGIEDKSSPSPFQFDQLDKIFKVLGNPTADKWPTLTTLPHWAQNRQSIQSRKYDNPGFYSIVQLPPKSPGFDLLSKMLEYDPIKRITAAQALEHEYFRNDPIPGRNSLVPANSADKVIRICISSF